MRRAEARRTPMSSLLGHPLITLRYPPSWIRDVNPSHEATRRDTCSGSATSASPTPALLAAPLAAMNVGWYGGAPFPRRGPRSSPPSCASSRSGSCTTGSSRAWARTRRCSRTVVGMPARCRTGSPFVRGWWQLGRQATMSPAGCRGSPRGSSTGWRHARRRGAPRARRDARRALHVPGRARCQHRPSADRCWIEYAAGRRLDAHVLADPDVARRAARRARVVFQNDIAGFDKDAARGWPNAVLSLAAEKGISIAAAFAAAEVLHEETVAALDAAGARLLHRHGDAVRFWVMGLYRLVAGACPVARTDPSLHRDAARRAALAGEVAPRAPSRPAHFAPPRHDEGR
ncbi:MAG: hypothetical protein U0359_41035 [Byssovorax sp.]